MTCQRCGREATVHLSETIDDQRREAHLCAACARNAGLGGAEPPAPTLLDSLVDQMITKHVGELVGELSRSTCPLCGITFMEFRIDGRLGCPHDYAAFAKGLPALLIKAHGSTRHVGKVPRRGGGNAPDPRLGLRAELRHAVAAEDYERAAGLRDRLRELEDAGR